MHNNQHFYKESEATIYSVIIRAMQILIPKAAAAATQGRFQLSDCVILVILVCY